MKEHPLQLPLFNGAVDKGAVDKGAVDSGGAEPFRLKRPAGSGRTHARTVAINPHLLAARRIARKMHQMPDRSEAETRAGLAICARLKAFLADGDVSGGESRPARH